MPERIETPAVLLRRRTQPDSDAMVAMIEGSLEHLSAWMEWLADGFDPATTYENGRDAERAWAHGTMFQYVLEAECRPVGTVAVHVDGDAGEVGYWLVRDAQGRGYARTAVAALVEAAFERLGLARIEIWHDEANRRSGAIPDALGFRRRDRFTHPRRPRHGAEAGVDVVHEITAAEWRARSGQDG